MKKALIVLVVLLMLGSLAWSEEGKRPFASAFLELFGSVVAPMGIGVEFFLGPVGLGAELRGFFLKVEDVGVGTLEPGLSARWYLSDLEGGMFLMGGLSYLTAWGVGEAQAETADFGILKPKLALGYNVLFGKDKRTRFAIELGAVYMKWLYQGEAIEVFPSFILPHFLLMFGRAF